MWNLNRLRMLRELQLRGTVTEVAASLRYSPSSVSQQLSQLELEVGVRLLEPDGRRLRLTPRGEIVAGHAEAVMQLEERVRSALGALAPGRETVRVATLASATRSLLPRALDFLARDEPELRVEVVVVAPERGLAELETRGYDLVVAEQYPGHARERRPGVDYRSLGLDPMRVAVAPRSAARSLVDLAEAAWVMEPTGSAARRWAVQQCRAAGFEPDVRYEAADLGTHVSLVASGHAVSILPDLIWAAAEQPVDLIDLPTPLRREILTAARASAADAPGVRAVRRALREAMGGPSA